MKENETGSAWLHTSALSLSSSPPPFPQSVLPQMLMFSFSHIFSSALLNSTTLSLHLLPQHPFIAFQFLRHLLLSLLNFVHSCATRHCQKQVDTSFKNNGYWHAAVTTSTLLGKCPWVFQPASSSLLSSSTRALVKHREDHPKDVYWTCAQGYCGIQTANGLPRTVSLKLKEHYFLKYHCILSKISFY